MKFFARLSMTHAVPVFSFLILSQTADANVDRADGITILQCIIGILVFGLYLGNHYRSRISNAFKKFFSSSDGREGSEDRSE